MLLMETHSRFTTHRDSPSNAALLCPCYCRHMTAMKRSLDEISQAPASGLSKTERRRAAKQAKKERLGKGDGGDGAGGKQRKGGAGGDAATPRRNGKKGPKPKMTKEERRAKYTQKAYEAREKQNQAGPGANKTRCLGCRAWGHMVANCPDDKSRTGICFNCGSSKHALRVCPKPKHKDGALPHATCFVCKDKGHISAHCKLNANGIYPKGGFCKGCGSKHHLSWDCPDNPQTDKKKTNRKEASTAAVVASESDDGGESPAPAPAAEPRDGGKGGTPVTAAAGGKAKRRKADNPGSHARGAKTPAAALPGGDDLEDDGYYEPDDMPDAHVDAEGGEEFGGASVARKGAAGTASAPPKKKSKVVVF